jgi:two-component system heavy metal sensor histidine kinase CusS
VSNKPRSIAKQLVLLFTLSTAVLLLCGVGVLYWTVVRHASYEDNSALADKADALASDFEKHGGVTALNADINTPGGADRATFLVRVLDPAGVTIAETSGMATLLPANGFPPAASTEIAVPTEYHSAGKLFALTARRARKDGESDAVTNGQVFTIQVAQDRSGDERFATRFGFLVAAVLALGILAAALIARTIAHRGLRPLGEMKRSLGKVSPPVFSDRIDPARWPPELKPLAIAFDDMLERLDDSFTRLSQFSADLAHELRTPIANMLGEAQVALTRDRTAAEYRETIESSVGECERLSRIVDNLLFVARVDAAREPIARKRFDARAAVEKIGAFYQTIADDHHVTITCSGDGQIYADPDLFERAVGNLLDNALRFTPAHGSIHIVLSQHNTDFQVAVSDNGCGIAAEHLPRVFDRFYRAEPSRGSDGAGLGLALVKSIAKLHGGSAIIESNLGRGTTVKLIFPLPQK